VSQNWCENKDGVGHASRSNGLLCVEASWARVSQFALKLAKARWWVVHMAPSRRLRWDQVEDGWVNVMGSTGLFYPKIIVFYVLRPSGSLVI
jgi:hypothetical protein